MTWLNLQLRDNLGVFKSLSKIAINEVMVLTSYNYLIQLGLRFDAFIGRVSFFCQLLFSQNVVFRCFSSRVPHIHLMRDRKCHHATQYCMIGCLHQLPGERIGLGTNQYWSVLPFFFLLFFYYYLFYCTYMFKNYLFCNLLP